MVREKTMRIIFDKAEQKVEELEGTYYGNKENPYKAEGLKDDEFNFISGMNFVLSHLTDEYLETCVYSTGMKAFDEVLKERDTNLIKDFTQFGYREIESLITSFFNSYKEEDNDNNN